MLDSVEKRRELQERFASALAPPQPIDLRKPCGFTVFEVNRLSSPHIGAVDPDLRHSSPASSHPRCSLPHHR